MTRSRTVAVREQPNVVTVARRIEATPSAIFAVLADPRRHQEVDGTGMLRNSEATSPLSAVGDEFVMHMHNDEFGDYTMLNRVMEFELDRRISWEPTRRDISEDDWNHRWGYDLEPDGGATVVTEFFDCTRSPADALRILKNGTRWSEAMAQSLERLERLERHRDGHSHNVAVCGGAAAGALRSAVRLCGDLMR